jgi:hypothetical protein
MSSPPSVTMACSKEAKNGYKLLLFKNTAPKSEELQYFTTGFLLDKFVCCGSDITP